MVLIKLKVCTCCLVYYFLKSAPVFALRNDVFYLFVLSKHKDDVRSLVDVNKIFLLFIVNVAIIVSVPMFCM